MSLPGPMLSAELYEPESGGWIATGDLRIRRYSHTATLLTDGSVLVVGGHSLNGRSNRSAERYDPATGTWVEVGPLTTGRTEHTTTLLANGNVIVAGGNGVLGRLSSVELFDRTTRSWSATGSLGTQRLFHTATLLANGKVLVAGGFSEGGNPAVRSAELYDPASGTWSPTGSLNTARQVHTATLLPNGKVLVIGGHGGGYELASAELYDPASGTWSAAGSLSTTRVNHTATLLPNGKVLVAGGVEEGHIATSRAELYDPATNTWAATGSMSEARISPTATSLLNGKVLVAAGYRNTSLGADIRDTAELYDPATGTWSGTGRLDQKHQWTTATLLPNGQVVVAAGNAPAPAQLMNISTRALILTDDDVAIAGFIIPATTGPRRVILRAIGPSLPLGGAQLQDPMIELYRGNGLFARNDNWKINDQNGQSQETAIRDSTIPPNHDLESALVLTLDPGNYTAIVRGKSGGTGIGLVELYDSPFFSELVNISTRGFVGTGDNALIGGFIAGPEARGNQRILLRAMGPSMPVVGALADPFLELHDSNGATIAMNDNWKVDSQTGQSQEAAIRAVGVTPPPDERESSLVQVVAPGAYTAVLRGKDHTTGIALVEIYRPR